ncbi:MAG: TrkH family potassium uptake protein [Bacillota bacterium]
MLYIDRLKKRYKLIFKYAGSIIVGVGIIILLPLLVLPFYTSEMIEAKYFIIPSIIAIIIGLIMRGRKQETDVTLSLTEGGIIVVLTWIITAIISALPFILSGKLNFTQAIFESVSGWTTTGLSVVDVTKTSKIFLMWRSIMQFFGGAGLAVVMLSSIIGPHGLGLYNAEGRSDKLLPHVKRSTKMIMVIYTSYVVSGTLLYFLADMPFFDAINHSIAAISTGGFSTKANSIGAYNSLAIELITIILMFLGTINFATHYVLLKGKFKQFIKNGEIKFMFILVSILVPITSFLSLNKFFGSVSKSIRVAFFDLVSALSTTGFSTVSYTKWPGFPFLILILLMLIGGGTGSTAGGIKQYRVYLMIKSIYWNIRDIFEPKNSIKQNYVYRPEGKVYVENDHILGVYNFIGFYMLLYFLGVSVLVLNGYPLRDSLFEFASSIGTVGLSIGITSASAPASVLWAETFGMLLGRLEIFVLFFASVQFVKDVKLIFNKK